MELMYHNKQEWSQCTKYDSATQNWSAGWDSMWLSTRFKLYCMFTTHMELTQVTFKITYDATSYDHQMQQRMKRPAIKWIMLGHAAMESKSKNIVIRQNTYSKNRQSNFSSHIIPTLLAIKSYLLQTSISRKQSYYALCWVRNLSNNEVTSTKKADYDNKTIL